MELRQLRYFVAVAELLNFTQAAKRLHIAQPPLSRQIRALERELGVELLERNSGKVFLTYAGGVFLKEARSVLQRASQAAEAAKAANTGEQGMVRVGIGMGLGDTVSRIINAHLPLYPHVEIDVVNLPSGFQSEALIARRIDVGFLRPPLDKTQLASEKIFTERLTVVLRRSSPLAKHKRLSLKQIAKEPLLLIARNISSGVYDKTLDMYQKAGLSPKIVRTETTPLDEAGAILVDSGKGIYIAVGSHPCHPSFAGRLKVIPLSDASATVEAHVAWRKGERTRTVLDFIECTRELFKLRLSKRAGSKTPIQRGKYVASRSYR